METFLGRNESSVNLANVEGIYVSKGIVGRILGVGKVCLTTDKDIFQIDYVGNPDQVKNDVEKSM